MKQREKEEISASTLYIVPTPIGNLDDITRRAIIILSKVDLIAAEDVLHTELLLKNFSIDAQLFTLHEYNERKKTKTLLNKLHEGKSIALVSDAGTPLINDPGYHLVRSCHEEGIRVVPLPGACAAITALIASGLPSNRFCYEGFLPKKRKARCNVLKKLSQETRTLIFYESTHRLIESIGDMINELGSNRYVVLARELTKIWESIYGAPLSELATWIKEGKNRHKGEIVLLVEGYNQNKKVPSVIVLHTLLLLQKELSLKKAVALTAKIHRIKKNQLYRYAIEQKNK